MPRPDSVTNEDIYRWSSNIDNDPYFKSEQIKSVDPKDPVFREVLYAGLWLAEQLLSIGCSEEELARIQFTAGQLSYGGDPWEVHINMLASYLKSDLLWDRNSLN